MPVFNNALAGAAGQSGGAAGYKIERSLRFNDGDSAHLTRSFQAGNQKKWTWSSWIKRAELGATGRILRANPSGEAGIQFLNNDRLEVYHYENGSYVVQVVTDRVFRDPSAWFHLVVVYDSDQSTPADRLVIYINGVKETQFNTSTYPSPGYQSYLNSSTSHAIFGSDLFPAGYLADVHFLDGIAISDPDGVFGEFDADTGVWNPIEYTGSYTQNSPNDGTVWSSYWTGNKRALGLYGPDDSFDGDNNQTYPSSGAGNNTTWTVPTAFPSTDTIEIKVEAGADHPVTITRADNTTYDITTNGVQTLTGGLKAIKLTYNNVPSNASSLTYVKINGTTLLDGVDETGANSFRLDFDPDVGQIYSNGTLTGSIDSGNPITRAFDGSTSTGTWAGSGSGFELTFPTAVTVANSITVVGGSSQSNYKVIVDGTEHTITFPNGSSSYTQEVTVNVSGSFTGVKATSNYGELRGIKVDGKFITDHSAPGVDASGNRNHWTANNLQAGSPNNNTLSSHSHTGHPAGEPTSKFLDGSSSTYYTVVATSSNSTTTAEFTFGTSLSGTLEVLYQNGNSQVTGRISIDGGANYTALSTYSSPTWVSVGTISGNNVRLRATFNSGGGSTAYFYGIRVNGVNVVTAGAQSAIDCLIDSPTDYEASSGNNGGNYCTMSPIDHHGCTFANGNLDITAGSSKCGRGTFWANSGKWYFEFDITTYGNPYAGIASNGQLQHYVSANSIAANNSGTVYVSTDGTQTYPGKTVRLNAVGSYMCAFDLDNGKIWWGKDGTWYETASGANNSIALSTVEAGNGATEFSTHPSFGDYWTVQFGTSTNTSAYTLNAGQRPFEYPNSIPSGFKSLCTQNLDDPDIPNGNNQFKTVLRNGFGTGGGTVTTGFKPGLLWEKTRSGAGNHYLYDAVRGVGKILFPNTASNETNDTNLDQVSAFTNTGYTLGGNEWSTSTTLVGWAWKEGSNFASSSYDQSKVWSSFWSATGNGIESSNPATKSFDGVLTGLGMRLNGNSSCTWAPTGGYSYSGDFLIYACKDNNYTGVSWTVVHAGGTTDITSSVAAGTTMTELNLTNLGIQSPITSISFTSNANSNPRIAGMKANGKILVDAALVPVGSQNSTVYNDSQTFSTGLSGSGSGGYFHSSDPKTNAFDGKVTTRARWTGTADGILTATFTAISATTLRVKGHFFKNSSTANEDVMISVNGGNYVVPSDAGLTTFAEIQAASGNNLFIDCSSLITGGQVTSVSVKRRGTVSSASGLTIFAIEVDGKILVDSNQTPPNAPSLATKCHINADAGMSIVTYQANLTVNDTIYHGLGVKPHFAIFKNRDNTGGNGQVDWGVYHHDLGATKVMELNQNFGQQTFGGPFNNVEPDAYKFTLGTGGHSYLTNGPAGDDFMGYIFREVPGFSKFSTYTGSGSQQFIFCGFRPAWVMIKRYTDNTVGEWGIYDNTREPYNEIQKKVWANNNSGEEDHPNNSLDFVSNGFVVDPGSDAPNVQYTNNGNVGYLYAAFAESPFKYARAR